MLFIGDIHGNIAALKEIIKVHGHKPLCFLGDVLDSYTESPETQAECLEIVRDRCNKLGDVFVAGNHDLHYLYPGERFLRGSGFNNSNVIRFNEILKSFKDIKLAYQYQDYLVSHGGFTVPFMDRFKSFLSRRGFEFNELNIASIVNDMSRGIISIENPIFDVGRSRGGQEHSGGPLWCDYLDDLLVAPYKVKQIVGHTMRACIECGIANTLDGIYCIDTLNGRKPQVLEIEDDGKLTIHNVDIKNPLFG